MRYAAALNVPSCLNNSQFMDSKMRDLCWGTLQGTMSQVLCLLQMFDDNWSHQCESLRSILQGVTSEESLWQGRTDAGELFLAWEGSTETGTWILWAPSRRSLSVW